MKSFQEFIKEGKVIKQSPDKAESSSLFKQAEEIIAFAKRVMKSLKDKAKNPNL